MTQQPPVGPPHWGFMITLRHTTLGRTPLNGWPALCRDLYLTIHNTHKRRTSVPLTGFKPTIPASERRQTHSLDRAATGIGSIMFTHMIYFWNILGFEINDETMNWIQRVTNAKKKFIIALYLILLYLKGSSVGIATELRAGRSGIESRWGRDFPPVQTGPGAHPASCKMGTALSRG